MGGLGGLPAAGNIGYDAFHHHVPDNGTVFLFYASHIGMLDNNTLGYV